MTIYNRCIIPKLRLTMHEPDHEFGNENSPTERG